MATTTTTTTHDHYGEMVKRTNLSSSWNELRERVTPFLADPGGVIVHLFDKVQRPPAPAWYEVGTGDIYVDLSQIPGKHGTDATGSVNSVLAGVIAHEAAHFQWSNWLKEAQSLDQSTLSTMMAFEEGRIERLACNKTPGVRGQFRSMFREVVLASFMKQLPTAPHQVAYAYALLVGRVYTGYLFREELHSFTAAAGTILGDDVVDALEDILMQAMLCNTDTDYYRSYNFAKYVELAREWNDLIKDEFGDEAPISAPAGAEARSGGRPAPGTRPKPKPKPKSTPQPGDEGGDGGEDGGEDRTPEHENKITGFGATGPVEGDDGSFNEMSEEEQTILSQSMKELKESLEVNMKEIAMRPSRPEAFAKVFGVYKSRSESPWTRRAPNKDEREAATLLTKLFEKMSAPTITKRKVSSPVPPGRLRGREAVRMAADRSRGSMTTARPWEIEKRRHDAMPPITVAIATDTSGSMKWAESMVASTAWIFASAGQRIGARVASVTYGDRAEAVIYPGEHPEEVILRKANGGSEDFDGAMAALDGVLRLTDRRPGRKVLIIVSDGRYGRVNMSAKRKAWLNKLLDAGVDIIWMDNSIKSIRAMASGDGVDHRMKLVQVQPGDYETMVREAIRALGYK